jgi:hypothetical protein
MQLCLSWDVTTEGKVWCFYLYCKWNWFSVTLTRCTPAILFFLQQFLQDVMQRSGTGFLVIWIVSGCFFTEQICWLLEKGNCRLVKNLDVIHKTSSETGYVVIQYLTVDVVSLRQILNYMCFLHKFLQDGLVRNGEGYIFLELILPYPNGGMSSSSI